MNLSFTGLENQIVINSGKTSTLEIHNRKLFERICRSLMSLDGEQAIEPFSVTADGGKIVSAKNALLVVPTPLELPWGDKGLLGALFQKMAELVHETPETGDSLYEHHHAASRLLEEVALKMESDYAFAVEWDIQKFLKAFGFGVDRDPEDSIFDNCIKLLSLAEDMGFKKTLVFINLKLFLTDSELETLLERIFISNLQVLLVEAVPDFSPREHESKLVVDLDLLEA